VLGRDLAAGRIPEHHARADRVVTLSKYRRRDGDELADYCLRREFAHRRRADDRGDVSEAETSYHDAHRTQVDVLRTRAVSPSTWC